MLRLIMAVFLSFNLLACTSNAVKDIVQEEDWFKLGEYDASNGLIEKSEKSLRKISVEFSENETNYKDYLAGYEEALVVYCEPSNAYILGVTGKPYRKVCDRYPRGWAFEQDWLSGRKSRAGSTFE